MPAVELLTNNIENEQELYNYNDQEFNRQQFKRLQQAFEAQFELVFPDKNAAKTVVIIPSLSLDREILQKIKGVHYYEERMLCLLMLLRMPHTQVIFITSLPVDPVIIDYYLHLLPGITPYHAKQRLTLLSCYDASKESLTKKILTRPRLMERIRRCIPNGNIAHLSCFNVTEVERELAVKLNLPIYGCDPELQYLGTKSNNRKVFRTVGLKMPAGFEDLYSEEDIAEAIYKLKISNRKLDKVVVKINEGFSGEGNALFSYYGAPSEFLLREWIMIELPKRLKIVAVGVSYIDYIEKFTALGGIVEEFVPDIIKKTPSVQCRITPLGNCEIVSTHDQLTGGESGQVFLGATFPADQEYATDIAELGMEVCHKLKDYGVIGRFSIDFISVLKNDTWNHYAIEINLRKGGTTHPYIMLQFLTQGSYDSKTGKYLTANGQERFYLCSDNLQSDNYKGLTPHDLIEIATCKELMYSGSSQEGVMFHLISTLSQYGKLGVVCIGATAQRAEYFYNKTKAVLDEETHNIFGLKGSSIKG
jgi:hypothetical protein